MTTANAYTDFLRSLRAVRRYADRPVARPVLEQVLEVTRWTGSGKNRQPWEVVVVQDRPALQALSGFGRYAGHLSGASAAVVLVMADESDRFDAGRLAQNVMLAAWAHGVGSCPATFSTAQDVERARELLDLPADRWLRHSIALGYPSGDRSEWIGGLAPDVVPRGRKPLSSFVHWERYGQQGAPRQ